MLQALSSASLAIYDLLNEMDAFGVVVSLVVLYLFLPCKYDPAILLKEWLDGE